MTVRHEPAEAELGTVSHGTLRVQDLLPSFLEVLSSLSPARYSELMLGLDSEYRRSCTPVGIACYQQGYMRGLDLCDDSPWWGSERAGELLFEVAESLDSLSPPGARFGAHEGGGSDFGFWADPGD